MRTVFKKEMILRLKSLLIWSFSVGALGLVCILLYQSMEGEMKDMADAFSNMGAFSEAFGMSTLSIATMKGYFATEVGTVHGLGSGMFAAITAITVISGEEDGHTGEFLFSLPLSRTKILAAKALCVFVMLLVFTAVCTCFYMVGFMMVGEEVPAGQFLTFMVRQFVMDAEIAGICFGLSSLAGKNRTGLGLGTALFLYAYDVFGRVVPDLKDYLFLGPFSYANASEIFTDADFPAKALFVGTLITVCAVVFAFFNYNRRDLAS